MRNVILSVMACAAIAACGPSGKEVAMAKQARYQGDKLELYASMKNAVEGKYKIEVADETQLGLKTIARWYTPEGVVSNWTPEDGRGTNDPTGRSDSTRGLPDRSLNVALIAQLLPADGKWVVSVSPVIFRYNEGSPNFDKVDPKDPSLPGWVAGKADQLHYAIYNALKPYQVQTLGGIAPAPESQGAPAGGEAAPAGGEPAPAGGEPAPAGGEPAPAGGEPAPAPAGG